MSGGDDQWTYSLGVNLLHTDGFPRYGYRVTDRSDDRRRRDAAAAAAGRRSDQQGRRSPAASATSIRQPLRSTPASRCSAMRCVSTTPAPIVASTCSATTTIVGAGSATALFAPTSTARRHAEEQLTVFSNARSRIWEAEGCYDIDFNAVQLPQRLSRRALRRRIPGRPQARRVRRLDFGARNETETARTSQDPNPNDGSFTPIRARQMTNSVFAEQRLTLFRAARPHARRARRRDRGRRDLRDLARDRGLSYRRNRDEAARQRGTGDKAATLYQRFSPYGTPAWRPSRVSATTSASIKSCSTAARRPRRRPSTPAIAI